MTEQQYALAHGILQKHGLALNQKWEYFLYFCTGSGIGIPITHGLRYLPETNTVEPYEGAKTAYPALMKTVNDELKTIE